MKQEKNSSKKSGKLVNMSRYQMAQSEPTENISITGTIAFLEKFRFKQRN